MTPIYTNIIDAADVPAWEKEATAQGRVLDHWPLYEGRPDLIAVRHVATIEERDKARSYRYLGLNPPRR